MPEVARDISIGADFGTFLHLCASAIGAERILELGVGGGIGACYLALTPSCGEYVGVDIAPQALTLGGNNLRRCVDTSKLRLIEATFDDALDQLTAAGQLFDFIWLDGDHYTETTLRYAGKATALLKPGGIIGFDDVRWSGAMLEAWQVISAWDTFSHTIDAGRLGLCIRGEGTERPHHWDFSRALFWPWFAARHASQLPHVGPNPTM